MLKKKVIIIWVIILVSIDQIIKLIIDKYYLDVEFEIIPTLLDFKPTFNYKYFYVNSLFNLGDGFWMHIVLSLVAILIFLVIWSAFRAHTSKTLLIDTGFTITISGAISGLICTVFWGGTLDYFYLKPLFVFDLKDMYLNSFLPFFIIFAIKHKDTLKTMKGFSFGRKKEE